MAKDDRCEHGRELSNCPYLHVSTPGVEAALRAAIDIETLRGYHDSSFLDPPSYHEPDTADLWDCPQCVERFIERAKDIDIFVERAVKRAARQAPEPAPHVETTITPEMTLLCNEGGPATPRPDAAVEALAAEIVGEFTFGPGVDDYVVAAVNAGLSAIRERVAAALARRDS